MGDLKAKLVDGKRQTLEDMEKESVINVQLYACHNKHNQEFEIVGSAIKSKSLKKCLAAAGKKEDTTQNNNRYFDPAWCIGMILESIVAPSQCCRRPISSNGVPQRLPLVL